MTPGAEDTGSSLAFQEAAGDAFEFLVREYGYKFAGGDRQRVTWRSPRTDVAVEYDPYSAEVDVLVRPRALTVAGVLRVLKGDGSTPFTLSDIAAWGHADEVLAELPAVAENAPTLHQKLPQLAQWLRSLGDPLLRGNTTNFRELDRCVSRYSAEATRRARRQ